MASFVQMMQSTSKLQDLVQSVIQRIAVGPDRGRDISAAEAEQVMQAVLSGHVDPVQVAVILIALRMKRESIDEFLGLFAALQNSIEMQKVDVPELACLADPFDGYQRSISMTPFLPAVLAACGLPACISGVKVIGPKFGVTAHQVYELAGIDTFCSALSVARTIANDGWGYLDQSIYAPELYGLKNLRERIVKRSAITTLERLLTPLRAEHRTHMVLGFVHKAYPDIYTAVARAAGFDSALLLKGVEGGLAPAVNKPLRQYLAEFSSTDAQPERFTVELPANLVANTAAELPSPDSGVNAENTLQTGLEVLAGGGVTARKSLVLSAAHVLWRHQALNSFTHAVEKVEHCLDNGTALKRFNALR